MIIITGIKIGSQQSAEDVLESIDDWCNGLGFTNPWYYYPMFHKNNTLASSNLQDAYYRVLPDSFNYRVELKEVGWVVQWTLTLIEGIFG